MSHPAPASVPRRSLLSRLGPGILVAATGVGAADLAGGALAGSRLKLACLWIVVVGAALKFVLCEGLARWQLTSHTSVPEGAFRIGGRPVRWLFLGYLIVWSFCIGGMLMSACGECAQAILPLGNAATGRAVHGVIHSLVAVGLVLLGGFRLFERMMAICIAVMFTTVVAVTLLSQPDWSAVITGLFVPTIPDAGGQGVAWSMTLMAGVGGTVTMLCYGNWIREGGRRDTSFLSECRIDLAAGYVMTAIFGIAMVILGSRLLVDQRLNGANLVNSLAANMQTSLGTAGPAAAWMFRIGAWGAVFSSLLGVWQCIPELICEVGTEDTSQPDSLTPISGTKRYRAVLVLLATVPAVNLTSSLPAVQKLAGVTGAMFVPLFAMVLLALGWTKSGRQSGFRNGWMATGLLLLCLTLFVIFAVQKLAG